jgi:hypothetical protein
LELLLGVLDLQAQLQGFHISGLATCSNTPNIESVKVKGKERGFITQHRHIVGRGEVSTSPHLRNELRFKERKNWGKGQEVCPVK